MEISPLTEVLTEEIKSVFPRGFFIIIFAEERGTKPFCFCKDLVPTFLYLLELKRECLYFFSLTPPIFFIKQASKQKSRKEDT